MRCGGRYSIIGMKPDLIWRCRGPQAEINRNALEGAGNYEPCGEGALKSLRGLIEASRIELPEHLPPMAAGLVGYLAYDTVRLMERLPKPNPDPLGLPDGVFVRPTVMAIFDSVRDVVTFVTPVRPADGVDAESAYRGAIDVLSQATSRLETRQPHMH